MTPLVSVHVLASLLNLTPRRVQQLATADIIPKPERGKYDVKGSIQGYVKFLQEKAFSKAVRETDLRAESIRLKKAQADKAELEAAVASGDYLPLEEVADFINEIAVIYATQLNALGGRLANELSGIANPAEIRRRLLEESIRIRQITSDKLTGYAVSIGNTGRADRQADGPADP